MSSFLNNITVGGVLEVSQELVEVESSTPICEVLVLFDERKVSSIPIYATPTGCKHVTLCECEAPARKKYIGLISVIDIIAFLLKRHDEECVAFDVLMSETEIRCVIGSTAESSLDIALCIASASAPLLEITNKMSQGIHRFLIFEHGHADDSQSGSPYILTQTDVVAYFLNHLDMYPEVESALSRPVESILSHSKGELLSTHETAPLLEAVKKLRAHRAIPVVDSAGQIVATLSASDFVSLSPSTNISSYSQITVQDFLSIPDDDNGKYEGEKVYRPGAAVCITSKGSILSAVEFMIDYHKHRVWVVAPDDSTGLYAFGVGCISLTDVIRTFTLLIPHNQSPTV